MEREANYRLNRWKLELDRLVENTGMTLDYVADYIGTSYTTKAGFFRKLPKKRSTYIGIGMAFRQPLERINRWITEYGGKRKLYIKDVLDDLVWIYLIETNLSDRSGETNWFKQFDRFREEAADTYHLMWDVDLNDEMGTGTAEERFRIIPKDGDVRSFRSFIAENIDAFKTAYTKPRRMLDAYVKWILETQNRCAGNTSKITLNSLRGNLDDSMINYLSGNVNVVNVVNRSSKELTSGIKKIPKGRRTHISMCLALGMTTEEINRYLDLMGYSALDRSDREESKLVKALDDWESRHILQRRYKDKYLREAGGECVSDEEASTAGNDDTKTPKLSDAEELRAVSEMLQLRQDILDEIQFY